MRKPKQNNPAYWDHTYRKRVAALRREAERKGLGCWLCGRPFDLTLPANHPHAFTADHLVPLSHGGRVLGELRPACRSCNSSRGAKRVAENVKRPTTTRDW